MKRIFTKDTDIIKVDIGCNNQVIIEKEFGPLVMCSLKIIPDFENCQWIIAREKIEQDKDDNDVVSWEIVAKIDAQESINFRD